MLSKDIGVYSNSIEFQVEVAPGVYWVPLNTLGKSNYTKEEMKYVAQLSPDEKRSKIHNLYEAVQLFQVSNFQGTFDNVNHWIDENTLWQIHKNPEDAVYSNNGCCATDTNWLAYFLSGKYQSICSFCSANEDGNGHITSCIQQDDWFYFIDMMMCRNDSQAYLCQEDGTVENLLNSEISGFLYKCKDPIDFCRFNIDNCKRKNRLAPFAFYIRDTEYVSATGLYTGCNRVRFLIPDNEKPTILYLDRESQAELCITKIPNL